MTQQDTKFYQELTSRLKTFLDKFESSLNSDADEAVPVMNLITSLQEDLNSLDEKCGNMHSSLREDIANTLNDIENVRKKIDSRDYDITHNRDQCKEAIDSLQKKLRNLEKISDSYPKEFLKEFLSAVKTFFSTLLSDMNKTASATQNHIEPTVDAATTEKNQRLNEKFITGVNQIFNPQFVLDSVLDTCLRNWLNQPMYGEYAAEMHDIKNAYSTMRDLCWQITQNHNTNPQIDDKLAKAREKLIATLIRNPQNQNTETFIKNQLYEINNALLEVSASIQAIAETSPQIKAENIEDLTVQDNTVVEDFDTAEEQLNDEITEEKMAPIISKYDLSGIEEVKDTESV